LEETQVLRWQGKIIAIFWMEKKLRFFWTFQLGKHVCPSTVGDHAQLGV